MAPSTESATAPEVEPAEPVFETTEYTDVLVEQVDEGWIDPVVDHDGQVRTWPAGIRDTR